MKVSERLQQAKAKIKNIKNWCKGHEALDKDGFSVGAGSKRAVRFCALGAIYSGNGGYFALAARDILNEASRCGSIAALNDGHGYKTRHAKVLRAYDRAIQRAKKQDI